MSLCTKHKPYIICNLQEGVFVFATVIIFAVQPGFQVVYQAWDTVFHHQMKHCEESWKYDAQSSIFLEPRGVSSGDKTLCRMLEITSQTKWIINEFEK